MRSILREIKGISSRCETSIDPRVNFQSLQISGFAGPTVPIRYLFRQESEIVGGSWAPLAALVDANIHDRACFTAALAPGAAVFLTPTSGTETGTVNILRFQNPLGGQNNVGYDEPWAR
jgi:hypothetical protein